MGLRKLALRARVELRYEQRCTGMYRDVQIYTFRDGLNFGEGILNIQVKYTALMHVSLYLSDAQITKFSYPRCIAARARALPKMFVVN